jgi:hypothetical protein
MAITGLTQGTTGPRWGEGLVLCTAAPGLLAAAVLGLGLALDVLEWHANLGPFTPGAALIAASSPVLVVMGAFSLIGGVLVASRVPGRTQAKWSILIAGTLALGVAAYWLSVPGLVELP